MNRTPPPRHHSTQTLRLLLAGLCILLILFTGAAQLLHTHATEEAANPGCSLCAIAHLSVLAAPFLPNPVATEAILPLRAPETRLAPQRLFSFSTYVRPPPALTAHC